METVKTPVAKTTKTPAKKTATKTAPAKTAKVAKAPKEAKERKVKVTSPKVSPVIASITGLINDSTVTVDDLKSLRLELRKCIKATRGTIRTRNVAAPKA